MNKKTDFTAGPVAEIIKKHGKDRENLISILKEIQDHYHYLPEKALIELNELSGISHAAIIEVASFYNSFRFQPAGKHFIKVCIGTACHVKGAPQVFNSFLKILNIPQGQDTDSKHLFTVQEVACLGCCMLAPAVQIDKIIYGHVTPQNTTAVLNDFLKSENRQDKKKQDSALKIPRKIKGTVSLCTCSSCQAAGADKTYTSLLKQKNKYHLPVIVKSVSCTGQSSEAPLIDINRDKQIYRYGRVSPEMTESILLNHFNPNHLVDKFKWQTNQILSYIYTGEKNESVTRYQIQVRPEIQDNSAGRKIVLESSGQLEPTDLSVYKAAQGFTALENCLKNMTPETIISQIKQSGLRGRGGGGYSTGKKWEQVYRHNSRQKYIICNGDEGDPGAFMDRMILESFPYRVIEGILLAAFAVRADFGFVYIRSEYPLALERMQMALKKCENENLIGDHIFSTDFSFRLKIIQGAGAFVCGEETALISSVSGKRGMPHLRPPYPAEKGYRGKPTLINNVETLAMIPWILKNGAKSFNSLGTKNSKGTKTFALAGKIMKGGLVEVPMGMTINEIIFEIGGGIQDGKTFKAVQIGGPSGGCIPASLGETKIDYDELTAHGAIMGSGGLVVLDETDCMVDLARYFMVFTQSESCGKCTFCRIGTRRILDHLTRLCEGRGTIQDIDSMEELSHWVAKGSLCGLGKTAPNPVLSTLHHFRDEYTAHTQKKCPAKKCQALICFEITDKCIGCTLCAQKCPVKAIPMTPYSKHNIEQEKCTKCGICRETCPNQAIEVT